MKDNVVIIGAGINGLVAANYLQRNGYAVTLLEKKPAAGGACTVDSVVFSGVEYQYACGASVLGFMQDFVFRETGLADKLTVYTPQHPAVVYFEGDDAPCYLYDDVEQRAAETREKWGETGDIRGFARDLDRVVRFLCDGYRKAEVPTIESAEKHLGCAMTELWISGSARDLLNTYFTSEKTKVYYAIDVVESGPVALDSPYSAFNIPLMGSGTVFGGEWGFVRGRIWNVAQAMCDLNASIGVQLVTAAEVIEVSPETRVVKYLCTTDNTAHTVEADLILFATDPSNAARLSNQPALINVAAEKKILGTSGKLVMFFKSPVRWKGNKQEYPDFDAAFKFVISTQTLDQLESASQAAIRAENDFTAGFCEIYCEGAAMRHLGENPSFDIVSVFVKNLSFNKPGAELPAVQMTIAEKVLAWIENGDDLIGSVLLTPRDLHQRFDFPAGNIDHIEICDGQTFFNRTWSPDPFSNFYQFGNDDRIMYCAAGSYPCGSIAGTPGYMCARQIIAGRELRKSRPLKSSRILT